MIKTIKMAKKERNQWLKTNHQLMPDHQNMAAVIEDDSESVESENEMNTANDELIQ